MNHTDPPKSAAAITPGSPLPPNVRGIHCGGAAGSISAKLLNDATYQTHYINLGQNLPGFFVAVQASGTTATGLLALFC